jgi:hypothetical protein
MAHTLTLDLLSDELAICRLPVDVAVPNWAWAGELTSITSTDDELSLVCAAADVPDDVEHSAGWRAFKVRGPLDFHLVGILSGLSTALADAGISIFAISTYETDYILVRDAELDDAKQALSNAGYSIASNAAAIHMRAGRGQVLAKSCQTRRGLRIAGQGASQLAPGSAGDHLWSRQAIEFVQRPARCGPGCVAVVRSPIQGSCRWTVDLGRESISKSRVGPAVVVEPYGLVDRSARLLPADEGLTQAVLLFEDPIEPFSDRVLSAVVDLGHAHRQVAITKTADVLVAAVLTSAI